MPDDVLFVQKHKIFRASPEKRSSKCFLAAHFLMKRSEVSGNREIIDASVLGCATAQKIYSFSINTSFNSISPFTITMIRLLIINI